MSTSVRESVEGIFAAVSDKDLAAMQAYFADDAVLIDPHYPSPRMVGKAAIADGLNWAFAVMKQFGFTIVHYFEAADGEGAGVEVATHHVLSNGMHLQFPQAFFFEMHDGLITRMQAYEPYGPQGIGGLVLGVTRWQWRLKGRRMKRIGGVPGS